MLRKQASTVGLVIQKFDSVNENAPKPPVEKKEQSSMEKIKEVL
jgi:hypothetical protein